MRKSKEQTAESRRRILQEAARLYREKGFDGVGVAEIMDAAGLTHGGFYRHFSSKEALIAEAMAQAFADRLSALKARDDVAGTELLRGFVEGYLSERHLRAPEKGCPVAALGSEAAHLGGDVAHVFETGIDRVIDVLAQAIGGDTPAHRAQALRLLATLAGAVVISRAAGDRSDLCAEVLAAVRQDDEIARLLKPG